MTTPSFNDYNITEMAAHRSGTLSAIPHADFTQLLAAGTDNDHVTTDIGFPFVFEGEPYTQIRVSTNGVIQLVGGGTTLLSTTTVTGSTINSAAPGNIDSILADPVIAPWWGDIRTADSVHRGGVFKHVRALGYAGHQEAIFRSVCYASNGSTSVSAYIITFEVALNSLGGISFRYAPYVTIGLPSSSFTNIGVGMKARNNVVRFKLIKGTSSGSLTVENDWPVRPNFERSYLMTPPKRLVVMSTPVTNLRTVR